MVPRVEYRSSRSADGSRSRRLTLVPGLASALADIPRDELTTLARVWDVPTPESPGTAAALYHRMTDAQVLAVVQSALGENARLLLRRLVTRSRPTRRSTLAELVPFAEDVVDEIIQDLRNLGLVWPVEPPGDVGDLAEVWWFVPRDLARAIRSTRISARATPPTAVHASAGSRALPSPSPGLTPLDIESVQAAPIAAATSILERVLGGEEILAIMSELDAEKVRDVVHLGVALGVLEARGRTVIPGARSGAWLKLADPERIRAFTRIWSVDETDPLAVPAIVRRAVLSVLWTVQPGSWYDANDVARLVAVQTGIAPAAALANADRPLTGIDRSMVDRAIVALGILGTLSVALDERDRPTALRLTDVGAAAIR